ncbi:putative Ig domain-containing protein [Candidatus Woesearchaeota archaeon]|nr:putative Ig domain-containing protein [Candidatus Woesearchaeota archaeon]
MKQLLALLLMLVLLGVNVVADTINPVLTAIGPQTINELATLTFTAAATDDGTENTLTYSLSGSVPAGASITSAGVFTWTPTEAQGPGSYTFDVVVSDNTSPALTDSETITVTVTEVNVAPVLAAIGPKSVNELAALTFTATATDADLPANSLTFSLTGAPTGASITSAGVFTWTPTADQGPGTYSFYVVVSDNTNPALIDNEQITVTVNVPDTRSQDQRDFDEYVDDYDALESDYFDYKKDYERAEDRDDESDLEDAEDNLREVADDLDSLLDDVNDLQDRAEDRSDEDDDLLNDIEDLQDDIDALLSKIDNVLSPEQPQDDDYIQPVQPTPRTTPNEDAQKPRVVYTQLPPEALSNLGAVSAEEEPQTTGSMSLAWLMGGVLIALAMIVFLFALLLIKK